ncbi:MAG: S8 family serine peptidase [Clostridia bacterium]|nr:S8 family serine peptidase [Clostridia bacterium]
MKRARTILAVVLALVMVLSVLPASFADEAKLPEKTERLKKFDGQSEATKSDKNVKTLDTRLKKVDTLDPDTEVPVIVVFDEPALSDTFTAEEIRAKKAESVQNRLSGEHDTFFKSLSFEAKRVYDYTALVNGMSIVTAYKNIAQLEKMNGVKRVYVANSYNAPEVQTPDQLNANTITGADLMQNLEYKGEGMVVAILDTGLNLTHEAFQDYGLLTDPAFTEEYVASVETTVPGIYVSAKVPFAYDYYHGDDDVTDYRGHGSHVSGTIAGFALDPDGAIKFSGAAPAAQICFMKIFSDTTGGTNSSIYIAALEDAFLLGVDAINMSLGSPAGFVYDPYVEDEIYGNVYKKLDQAGVIMCCSAGNEYSLAYQSANLAGDGYVLADLADYGLVGTPSSYEGNVSVASMENLAYPSYAIEYNGVNYAFVDNCSDGEHGWLDTFAGKSFEIVDCGKANPDEIPEEVAGKVALVVRGDLSFSEKNANVAAAGAIGMILYNNQSGSIGMLIDPYYVPAISIQQAAGLEILAGLEADNTVTVPKDQVNVDNPNAWLMSSFSSWGCTPNLELKPTITAPGGMIYSAVNGESDAYEVYSGTSMASPNACGTFLLLSQYLKETQPSLSKAQRAELAEDLAESTATLPFDADDYLYSPRKSGSGLINAPDAISTPVYLVEPIVNLYDDPNKEGVFTIRYTLVNLTDSEQVYAADVIGLFDYVTSGYNTLTSDYLFDGEGITVEGDLNPVVPANGKFDGKITITLDDATKEKFDADFANGNFVEGYIAFYSDSEENTGITVPVNEGTLGDANLDGKVTAADAAEILRAIVGLTELSEEAQAMADVNEDGTVTAADASFILRAIVGLETLPAIIGEEEAEPSLVHLTFMGFYGDWTQAPVLDRTWTNDPNYLMYWAAMQVMYPQYIAAGYLPINLWDRFETNIAVHEMYGGRSSTGDLYTYFGTNPQTTLGNSDEIILDAWNDVMNNYSPLHNAISNYTTDSYYVNDWMYTLPIQLRNARHLIMTVTDAQTGEVYFVDDTEYLGKVYFDTDTATWGARGSFYWDGINMNESSEGYGDYVPNGTICYVSYETMIDYPGAELNEEYGFYMIVDTESPVITGVEFAEEQVEATEEGEEPTAKKTVTVSFDDNGSGVAFVDAYCYDKELNTIDLGYAVGTDTAAFEIDLSLVPEGVDYIVLDAMDYATNWPDYNLNIKTGEVSMNKYDFMSVQFAADKIFNDKDALGSVVMVEGVVTEIYKDVVYIQSTNPYLDDPGFGLAVELADQEALADITIGDMWIFSGEMDNYYGCPTLKNAEALYIEYQNVYYAESNWDPGDSLLYIPYTYFTLTDIQNDPGRFTGECFFFDELTILGVTEIGDGTRTLSVTDGTSCIDIVATYGCEGAQAGNTVFVVGTIVFDMGTPQIRPLCDESMFWIESY